MSEIIQYIGGMTLYVLLAICAARFSWTLVGLIQRKLEDK